MFWQGIRYIEEDVCRGTGLVGNRRKGRNRDKLEVVICKWLRLIAQRREGGTVLIPLEEAVLEHRLYLSGKGR